MAATVTLGGVSIPGALLDSELDFARQNRWASAEPLGYTGRINTVIGVDPIQHFYHCRLTSAQRTSVQSLVDAAAAVAFSYTNGDISISQNVLIKRFTARKNRAVAPLELWDCEMELEEQP